jgi:prophage maintenance system killer protein
VLLVLNGQQLDATADDAERVILGVAEGGERSCGSRPSPR